MTKAEGLGSVWVVGGGWLGGAVNRWDRMQLLLFQLSLGRKEYISSVMLDQRVTCSWTDGSGGT